MKLTKPLLLAVIVAISGCSDSSTSPDARADSGIEIGVDQGADSTQPDTALPDGPSPDGPSPDGPAPDGPGPDGPSPDTAADAPAPDQAGDAPRDSRRPDTTVDAPTPDTTVDAPAPDTTVDAPAPDTTVDAPLPDTSVDGPLCAPRLNPTSDGTSLPTGGIPDLVMSEIRPGFFVELYNTTTSPIAISSIAHELCSPFLYIALSNVNIGAGVIVPARGYATVRWPTSFADTAAGGEVILYRARPFIANNILDFVCWGTNPHGSRLGQAVGVGKWSGTCGGALAAGSIHRRIGVNGTTSASYDRVSVASPHNCTAR